MNVLPVSSNQPLNQRVMSGVSILALDALKPASKLNPGEPLSLAPGVTISVMQSAVEALLEVERVAGTTVTVDNSPALELATVRPGQIIRTDAGRYTILRHLQSLIIPRAAGYERPAYVNQMIQLALANLAAKEVGTGATNAKSDASSELAIALKKKNVRLTLLCTATAAMLGWAYVSVTVPPLPKHTTGEPAAQVVAPIAETRRAVPEQATQPAASSVAPAVASAAPTVPAAAAAATFTTAVATSPKSTPVEAELADVEAGKNARKHTKSARLAAPRAANADDTGPVLSLKDRQTLQEYKLEAKFDHVAARVKMQDMAKGFPAGSAARTEIERAMKKL